ncbi:MAG: hypothetical protein ACYS1A_00150 [Planctomycetota bacterium]|jgi:hypothetical protein
MKKHLRIILYIFAAIGVLALAVLGWELLVRLFLDSMWQHTELHRLPSPDGKYEAVIERSDAGAMASTHYGICIVSKGGTFKENDVVFHTYDLNPDAVRWISGRKLQVTHPPEKILHYEPVWPDPRYSGEKDFVEVHLNIEFEQ